MKHKKKNYWKGLEELTNDTEFVKYANKEFANELPINGETNDKDNDYTHSRRDFLKTMGFSIAAASLVACEAPIRHTIPWLNKPEDIDPGIPNYYASTYNCKGNFASIIVKTREGRPIKIEGNPENALSMGGTSAQIEASVLSLYDDNRLKKPVLNNKYASWDKIDTHVIAQLNKIVSQGKKVALVSNSIISPVYQTAISNFQEKYATEWISYDAFPYDGILNASEKIVNQRVIPDYHFDKANVVVGFNVDYLGTWGLPITFSKRISKRRKLSPNTKRMSRIYQFEGNLSLTGANADYRGRLNPSQEGLAISYLYNEIAKNIGETQISIKGTKIPYLQKAAQDLLNAKSSSIVISDSNDENIQLLVLKINHLLGNINSTLDFKKPLTIKNGNTQKLISFVDGLKNKQYGAVIFLDANPVYDSSLGEEIKKHLKNVTLTVNTAQTKNETGFECQVLAPTSHYLESWGDASPKKGVYTLMQPTINPIFKTRESEVSLLIWSGHENITAYDNLKQFWQEKIFKNNDLLGEEWKKALYKGEYTTSDTINAGTDNVNATATEPTAPNFDFDVQNIASLIQKQYSSKLQGITIQFYQKVSIKDGTDANNPWLQEMPDPITKATWENYVTISQKKAKELNIIQYEENTGLVNLSIGKHTLEVPVVIQPGQEENTVGIAIGFGRTAAGKVGSNIGFNAYPLLSKLLNGTTAMFATKANITSSNKVYRLARTQTHETFMGRDSIIQEATFNEFKENPAAGRKIIEISTYEGKKAPETLSLWSGHKYGNHHWGMAIDLTTCIGCSACHISCQAENNIPVVGKEEVLARREMHWMRIDRYYSSDAPVDDLDGLEEASANPEVVFQPMLCQHCNNAPCETVCPVLATTHSTEGLNQMTYNRCIGTRYCANNCPYKVRRFNWFKYHDNKQFSDNSSMNNNLGKMVLNPDVTVRSRGVMEKCSLCVQRIQYGKLEAKKENRRPIDGEIQTACASSCPTGAIVFGDMNDKNSAISHLLGPKKDHKDGTVVELNNPRAYHVLEEINVRPNISYLTKIKNKDEQMKNESES